MLLSGLGLCNCHLSLLGKHVHLIITVVMQSCGCKVMCNRMIQVRSFKRLYTSLISVVLTEYNHQLQIHIPTHLS